LVHLFRCGMVHQAISVNPAQLHKNNAY
jgi:hypothetical protein